MTKRRRFGRVRKLPSGRWQARYPDGNGVEIAAPSTFVTKGEADRWLVLVEADLTRGQYIDPRAGQVRLGDWAEQWLCRPAKHPNSVERDRQALRVFMPALGARPLSSITPLHVQSAVDARGQTVAPATLVRDVAALRAVLNSAVDADLIARSPARRVALPRVRPPERRTLTAEELLLLAEAVPERYRALILTGGVLGLRWGETIGLRVCDIDVTRRAVTVAQVVEEIAGHVRVVRDAKTARSLRTLTAPAFLIEELERHLAKHRLDIRDDKDALVFLGPRGGILRRRLAERVFAPAVARAGLDRSLTFQELRHVAMSALVDERVHPRVMQGRAGHATSKLTMELYAHVSDGADREAADALESQFRAALDRRERQGRGTRGPYSPR